MDDRLDVLAAATARAEALVAGKADRLAQLLHPEFHWTSHRGERFDRDEYLRSNTGAAHRWKSQSLLDPEMTVLDGVAVLRCTVVDVVASVDPGGGDQTFRMPLTQVWVRLDGRWACLAGHAGPLLSAE